MKNIKTKELCYRFQHSFVCDFRLFGVSILFTKKCRYCIIILWYFFDIIATYSDYLQAKPNLTYEQDASDDAEEKISRFRADIDLLTLLYQTDYYYEN